MSVSWGKRTTKLDKSTILYAIANRKYVEAGEPFFLTDIVIEGMSEENIRYYLKKLTDDGVICRFKSGVYYIPKINIFGEQSSLSAETVALHKYFFRRPAVEVTEENAFKEIIEQVADDTGCAAVVIEKAHPHSLRHLFALTYIDTYNNIGELADILGHSSLEITRIYLSSSREEKRNKMNRLNL